jgi:hypothetical protein
LDQKVEFEKNHYTKMKDDFDQRWQAMRKDDMDGALQEVRRQIESVSPKLALDQLLRILDDKSLDASAALHHVVTIFKSVPADKRKRIVAEFQQKDAARLQEILREIRLGTPQATLIRDARRRLAESQPES